MRLTNTWLKNRTNTTTSKRRLAPMIEAIESRELLTGGCIGGVAAGFLGGTVLADGNSNAPVCGVTIQLYKPGSCTPLATTTTDSHGNYQFTGLQPGNYQLKEVVPCGYSAVGTDINSQLNAAKAASSTTINVTVADPNKLVVNYNGIGDNYALVNDVVKGVAQPNAAGQMKVSLGTTAGATDVNGGFLTFCVNDLQSLSFGGGEKFAVQAKPISQLTDGTNLVSADHAGRVAYLFNHYGNSSLTNIQGAAMQLAIWELLYDQGNTADFNGGNFKITGPYAPTTQSDLNQVITQATNYFNESAGHIEIAAFLDTTGVNGGSVSGLQSVLATCSLNFNVHNNCPPPPTNTGGCGGWNWGSWCGGGSSYGGWCTTSYGGWGSTSYTGGSCSTGSTWGGYNWSSWCTNVVSSCSTWTNLCSTTTWGGCSTLKGGFCW